jgi:hypothetical protein
MSSGFLDLTPEESAQYKGLPMDVVLERYKKAHRNERCPHCQKIIGNHSLKSFKKCVGTEQAKLKFESDKKVMDMALSKSIHPTEVALITCRNCSKAAPPFIRCIHCGARLEERLLVVP